MSAGNQSDRWTIAARQMALLEDLRRIINRTTHWACLFLLWAVAATGVAVVEAIVR